MWPRLSHDGKHEHRFELRSTVKAREGPLPDKECRRRGDIGRKWAQEHGQ